MPYSDDQIRQIVRRVVLRTLNITSEVAPSGEAQPRRSVITAEDVSQAKPGTEMQVESASLVTPLARQVAMERGVTFSRATSDRGADQSAHAKDHVVAIGSDHGGFEMKEQLKNYLVEMGYDHIDCGTHSKESVDYPDFAFAVGRQVADGSAFRGIIIDGAGIGSCIAANKIPGVRAAMCYDQATAVNSREHNNANVLTLGAGLIGHNLAQQIVNTWLRTDFGGGRHGRRVNKITEIEQRYSKGR